MGMRIFLHLQKHSTGIKIWMKSFSSRENKDVKKSLVAKALFLVLFVFSMAHHSFGRADERAGDEQEQSEENNQLLALPIFYYTPETKMAGGLGGIYYLRSLTDRSKGHPSTLFVDMICTTRLSAAGFVGCGGVAEKLASFELEDFKVSGGLGIRYRINRDAGTNMRLDFGFAQGNLGVYATINESF
jgi:hypothetical protein